MSRSALYTGQVMHRRLRPRAHHLKYRLFSLWLDLDEIDALAGRLRLFSRRRFNLFSFHDADHLDGTGTPLRMQVEARLAAAGLDLGGGPIRLLAMPRVLGFGFNPLSVWFCFRPDGTCGAIIHEVHNTFGERHCYVLPVEGDGSGAIGQACDKAFHVSPFMAMGLRYAFRLRVPGDRLAIGIAVSDAAGPLLSAAHTGQARALTDGALLRVFVTHPLLTIKVVGAILWEAARLWGKRVPVFTHVPQGPVRLSGPTIPPAHATPANASAGA